MYAEVPQPFTPSVTTQQNCFGYFLTENDYTQAPVHANRLAAELWLCSQPFYNSLAQDGVPSLYFPCYPATVVQDFHWAFLSKDGWSHKRGQMNAQLENHLSMDEHSMADFVANLGYEEPIFFHRILKT